MATSKIKLIKSAIQSKTSRHVKKQENITKIEEIYQPFKSDPKLIETPKLGDMELKVIKTVLQMFKKLTKDIEDVKKKSPNQVYRAQNDNVQG